MSTTDRFHKYTLTSLLPEGQTLVTDARLLVVTVLDESGCMPIAQEQLTEEEALLFEVLLLHLPYHCPYADLCARFYRKPLAQAQDDLQHADPHAWDAMLRPMRNMLSRARKKVRPLGLDFKSMIDTGYMLIPAGRGIQ